MRRLQLLPLALFASCSAPERVPEVGDQMPHLGRLQVVSPIEASAPERLPQGTAMVLTFWSSWCLPSRSAFPHLMELESELAGEPILFVAISNESRAQLMDTLGELDVPGTVVRDDWGSAFERVGVRGLPVTFLLTSEGRVAAITHPTEITTGSLRALIAGERLSLPESDVLDQHPFQRDWDLRSLEASGTSPRVELEATEVRGKYKRFSKRTGEIAVPGSPLKDLVVGALGRPRELIDIQLPSSLGDRLFEAYVVPPDGKLSTSRALLLDALRDSFGLRVREVERELDTLVLTLAAGHSGPTPVSVTDSELTSMGPELSGTGTATDLAEWLGKLQRIPVADETDLGALRFQIELSAMDQVVLDDALGGLGLTTNVAKRTQTVSVVER